MLRALPYLQLTQGDQQHPCNGSPGPTDVRWLLFPPHPLNTFLPGSSPPDIPSLEVPQTYLDMLDTPLYLECSSCRHPQDSLTSFKALFKCQLPGDPD